MAWYTDNETDDVNTSEILYFLQGFHSPGNVFCYIMSPLCDIAPIIEFFWSSASVKSDSSLLLMTAQQVIVPPFDVPTYTQAWVNTIVNLAVATYVPSLGVPLYINMKDEFEDRMFALLCCKPEHLVVTRTIHDHIVRIFFALGEWFISIDEVIHNTKNAPCNIKINMFLQLFKKKAGTPFRNSLQFFDEQRVLFIFVVRDELFYVGSCEQGSCVHPRNTPMTGAAPEHGFPLGLLPSVPLLNVCNLKIHARSKHCTVGILNTVNMKLIYVSMTSYLPRNMPQSTLLATLCLHAYQSTHSSEAVEVSEWRQQCAKWGNAIDQKRFQTYRLVYDSSAPLRIDHLYDTQQIISHVRFLMKRCNKFY